MVANTFDPNPREQQEHQEDTKQQEGSKILRSEALHLSDSSAFVEPDAGEEDDALLGNNSEEIIIPITGGASVAHSNSNLEQISENIDNENNFTNLSMAKQHNNNSWLAKMFPPLGVMGNWLRRFNPQIRNVVPRSSSLVGSWYLSPEQHIFEFFVFNTIFIVLLAYFTAQIIAHGWRSLFLFLSSSSVEPILHSSSDPLASLSLSLSLCSILQWM